MADVAVVVGNYKGAEVLAECLASLRDQTLPPRATFVVDADSTDASAAVAVAYGATLIATPNLGLGYLYNRGVEAAATEFVLLLNNDVALERRCVELLAAELVAAPARFAADPTQLDWAGQQVIHARTTLRRGSLLREFIPGLHLDSVVLADRVRPTVCANGAAMLVRRAMFLELGGFDETFFMEWEDLDLCWRAWLRGWSTVYVPAAIVRHRVGAVTTSSLAPRRRASAHHNLMRFALKCLPRAEAGRVLLGELLRLPAHPRAIATGGSRVAVELAEIVRLRRAQRPASALLDRVLDDEGAA